MRWRTWTDRPAVDGAKDANTGVGLAGGQGVESHVHVSRDLLTVGYIERLILLFFFLLLFLLLIIDFGLGDWELEVGELGEQNSSRGRF